LGAEMRCFLVWRWPQRLPCPRHDVNLSEPFIGRPIT